LKGFKKNGKFVPTTKRNKSSLKKSDLKPKTFSITETSYSTVVSTVKAKDEDEALELHFDGKSKLESHDHEDVDYEVEEE